MERKVRDRDEELRAKGRLLEEVQDELIALNLQVNVAEQQRAALKKENEELVARWMKRVGEEAEAMNRANGMGSVDSGGGGGATGGDVIASNTTAAKKVARRSATVPDVTPGSGRNDKKDKAAKSPDTGG